MKNLLITLVALFGVITNINAQDKDPWVGTWTSENIRAVNSTIVKEGGSVKYSTYKYIIRITKDENEYFARIKFSNLEDPSDVSYDDVTITGINGNTMWIETYAYAKSGDMELKVVNQKKLVLSGGVMKYSWYNQHRKEYDTKRKIIIEESDNTMDQSNKLCCFSLFNDDW